MVLPIGLQPDQMPRQPVQGIFNICWDELFAELRRYALPLGGRKPVLRGGNLVAETVQEYKSLLTWEVSQEAEGVIHEISLYTNRADTSRFKIMIADEAQFADFIIHTGTLTIPMKQLPVATKAKVIIMVKTTDGVATNFDAFIDAEERFYL